MSIPVGTRLGPYEILGLIGAGGMGEVHRARDTRLGRDVAIKTLPAGLVADPDRLRRFEIEARAASLLSHPGILSIFDIGTSEGQPYIVSELLDGENLRERLSRGPIAPRKVVEIGVAIADALAAAHARGIVHRDLKPENLFLLRDGRPKILDFGIAKLMTFEGLGPEMGATMTALTEVGVAVGTLGYMAPEQVRGETVDHRSDIFAFGAILHEMVAGTPAFRRDSRIATTNAILESDPPELADTVAPALRRIIQRCLEKQPDLRFQSARDLAFALDTLSGKHTATTDIKTERRSSRFDWRTAAIAVLLAATVGTVTWIARAPVPAPPAQMRRFLVAPPPDTTISDLAVSPDGRHLVLAAERPAPEARRLYLRSFDQVELRELPGTEGAVQPFFSPDGAWVGFEASGKLKKVALAGGSPIAICDVNVMLGASWGPNGNIVVAQREQGLSVVSAEGGALRPLTTPDASAGEIDHHAPSVLADGSAVIFTIHAGSEIFRIATRSLSTGAQRTIVSNGFDGQVVASGHILFGRGDSLYAAPFDATRQDVAGEPVAVVPGLYTEVGNGYASFDAASDGTLVYRQAAPPEDRSLVWVDRQGKAETIPTPRREFQFPSLSPDGKRLAIEVADGPRSDVWIFEFATGSFNRLTSTGFDGMPLWSRDSQRLAYTARRDEERHIMWQPVDGSATPESLVRSRNRIWASAWTPDGKGLVFVEDPPTSIPDIKLLDLTDRTRVSPLVAGPLPEMLPSISPDGRWIVYTMFDKGPHLMLRSFGGGAAREITSDGGAAPRWLPNGREIVSRRLGAFRLMKIQTTPELSISKPEDLFPISPNDSLWAPHAYDVAPDGSRFLFVRSEPAKSAPLGVSVVEHFFTELNRRAPVRE